jgi:hypothetical protein
VQLSPAARLKSFIRRIHFGWWAALAYLLLVVVLQFWLLPCWEKSFTNQALVTVDAPGNAALLIVAHPEAISAKPAPERAAVAAWVVGLTATPPPNPATPSSPPSLSSVAQTPTPAIAPSGSLSPTNTVTATSCPTVPAFELGLTSSPGGPAVTLSTGVLAPGPVLVTSAPGPATPVLFYLEPGGALTSTVRVTIRNAAALGSGEAAVFDVYQEPSWQFTVRRFLAAVSDPIAIAAALLAGFVGLVISRPFKELAKREEAIRSGLAELRAQSQIDWIAALHRYLELRARREEPWNDEAARQRLAEQWQDLTEKLKGDWAFAYTRLMERYDWTSDPAEAAKTLVSVCREGDSNVKEEAYRRFGDLLGRVAGQTQRDEAVASGALKAVTDVLADNPDQGQQIWDAEAVKTARDKLEQQTAERKWLSVAELLKQADFTLPGALRWPRPCQWREDFPPLITPEVAAALAAIKMKPEETPFGPERAQDEPRLHQFGFTEFVGRTATPEPAIIYGGDGMGKTAYALLLAAGGGPDSQPFNKDAFSVTPVPVDHLDLPMTHVDWLDVISAAFAGCQVRFLDANPHLLNPYAAHGRYRQAVLRLLVQHYGSIAGAVDAFPRESRGGTAFRLAAKQEPPPVRCAPLSTEDRIALLSHTIPPDLKYAYVILDQNLPNRDPLSPTVIDNLRCLMFLAPRLANKNIYLKAYLPVEVKERLPGFDWLRHFVLKWEPKDLHALLDNRFEAVSTNTFASVSQPGNLEGLFIEKCNRSPRRMVRLGNRLLEKMGRSNRWPVTEADILEAATEVGPYG